jgi:hypothetical protein
MDPTSLQRLRLARDKAARTWLSDPNVMLVDIGWAEHQGVLAPNKLVVRVHVKQKFPEGVALAAAARDGLTRGRIPDSILGVAVDRPQGDYHLQQWFGGRASTPARALRRAPMQGGISVSNAYRGGYGTLGGLVTDRTTGARMLLSNWHVLAGDWRARPGWPIYQPGRGDGGKRADTVATLSRHVMTAHIDAAVARLTGDRDLVNDQWDLAPARGVSWAELGMDVVKSGRRTGLTYGRITGVEGVLNISYRGVSRRIQNVVTIEPLDGRQVSAGGDSGSIWFHAPTMHAIGLHFAGSDRPERALAMDIQPVLDALNVDLSFTMG